MEKENRRKQFEKVQMRGLAYVICLRFQSLADAKQFAELEGLDVSSLGKANSREKIIPVEE